MVSAFDHHVAAAFEEAGIAPADLPAVIEEHAFSAVWGSAFEDLLARDQPDGRNIVDDYLKRRGWKESVPTREYMVGAAPVGAEPIRGERRRKRPSRNDRTSQSRRSVCHPKTERAIIQQSLEAHYRQTLDQPLPCSAVSAYGKRSAARGAWPKMLENNGMCRPPDAPMAGYDFRWMWVELGIERLRR